MTFKLLDTVVLKADIPEHGLKAGDVGAIVQLLGTQAAEVEFVTGSGRTQALLTLPISQLRQIGESDILAVRPTDEASAA